MKKLYYVIEKELHGQDGFEETTGNKTITVYDIFDNVPKIFCTIDTQVEYNSENEIQQYLDDNGYGDDEFEFIIL